MIMATLFGLSVLAYSVVLFLLPARDHLGGVLRRDL
jgi:hypothetical protein